MTPEEREQNRRAFIADAVEVMNRSLDYQETLVALAQVAVPRIADWCAVDMVEGGALQRLAVAHVDPAKLSLAREIERRWPADLAAAGGVPGIIKTGRPRIVSEITDEMLAATPDAEHRAALGALGLRSWIGVPLRRGEQTIGVISLIMAESGRRYDSADLALAVTLADRASSAIGNAHVMRELARAHEQAEAACRAKDEFLAMLGHELRNPLAPIVTALELIKLRSGDAMTKEHQVIERQVGHMLRLVDDLLDVSRIARGKVELKRKRVDLREVLARALEMAAPLMEQRKHHVAVDQPAEPVMVNGDESRLAQVVSNLLTNSARYTPPGGNVIVSLRSDGGEALLAVKDDGQGIDPALLPKVFDLFVQGDQTSERAAGGLGLGLTIVRSLVHQHGGRVAATSSGRGQGSTFSVILPIDGAHAAISGGASNARLPRAASSLKVLVVDDNEDARTLLSEILETAGHQVKTAGDAFAALEVVRAFLPDVAVLDLGLPVVDGFELAQKLRDRLEGATPRLIALSGYAQPTDRAKSARAGFAVHLVKPVDAANLLAQLTD